MEYRVVLADSARADATALYDRIVAAARERGPEWLDQLLDSVASLKSMPPRCPRAREPHLKRIGVRCLLFGRRRDVYRILYTIDDNRRPVTILHTRHGA